MTLFSNGVEVRRKSSYNKPHSEKAQPGSWAFSLLINMWLTGNVWNHIIHHLIKVASPKPTTQRLATT